MPIRHAEPAEGAYRYPLLIKQLLHAPLSTSLGQEIVYRDFHRYSYADLAQRIARLGSALSKLGVGAGITVAVLDWDSHRYLECYFAVPMLGAVLQTVNVRLAPDQIEYTLRETDAKVVLAHPDFAPLIERLRPNLPSVRHYVQLDEGPGGSTEAIPRSLGYESMLVDAAEEFSFPEFDENAIATTFHTTGSTGRPKAVCFSHRQIVLHTLALGCALASAPHGQNFHRGDVYMPLTPMFHVHAWGLPYLATTLGVKQVYAGRYVADEILALRHREGVTYSHCVPTILRMLLTDAASSGADLHGWKMTVGGASLVPALATDALAAGIDVFAGYGLSETGPALTVTGLRQPATKPPTDQELILRCRAGNPIPLVELQIWSPEGRQQPRDGKSPGEIVVRAPWTTPCYVGDTEESRRLWAQGFLHTQDVGVIDPLGVLRITDRIKDVIKSGGEWVSSLAIETAILNMSGVAEAAVIARPDERWGERPHAFVVAKTPGDPRITWETVRSHVAECAAQGQLPVYGVPDSVSLVDALPKTSVGKTDKQRLRIACSTGGVARIDGG
jgi:fatty-acyl-CoA synthase